MQIFKNIALGDIKQVDIGVGKAIALNKENSDIQLMEMQGSLEASRMIKKDQIDNMHQTNGATRNDPETARQGALSGFALSLLFAKSLATNERKRLTYGGGLQWVNYVAQILAGDTAEIVPNVWPNALPSNLREKAEIFQILEPLIGPYQAAIQAGYTEQEAVAMAEDETVRPLPL